MSKVFISHRSVDEVESERLATDIRNAGHQVWLDKWEIGAGDSIVERINIGLADATHVVMCLSFAGVLPPWMSREWMSALARQLEGQSVKLIPVRLTGGDPPAILADVKFADVTKSWSRGMAEILSALL